MTTGPGSIRFHDRPLQQWTPASLARRRAWLAQHQTPPFAMPVWHYLSLHQHDKSQSRLFTEIVTLFGLGDKLGRMASQLSVGEWQRVRLAAVTLQIRQPDQSAGQLLLLDEPVNSLDMRWQAALDRVLAMLCRAGVTIVMSSHDLNHTLRHAHRAWLLHRGRLVASGSSEQVLTPRYLALLYDMAFQRLNVDGHGALILPVQDKSEL